MNPDRMSVLSGHVKPFKCKDWVLLIFTYKKF